MSNTIEAAFTLLGIRYPSSPEGFSADILWQLRITAILSSHTETLFLCLGLKNGQWDPRCIFFRFTSLALDMTFQIKFSGDLSERRC
jgi:hypothetical protein